MHILNEYNGADVNGNAPLVERSKWVGRRAPRLWRRGVRIKWMNEVREAKATIGGSRGHDLGRERAYAGNQASLTTSLLMETNLHSGVKHFPGPFTFRFNGAGWKHPYLGSHLYFKEAPSQDLYNGTIAPSPIGDARDGYPDNIVLFDLPREKPGIISLGQFQHAQFSYLNWHPTFILGSSYSTPQSDLDATALRRKSDQPALTSRTHSYALLNRRFLVTDPTRANEERESSIKPFTHNSPYRAGPILQYADYNKAKEILHYDISYELNHALWDEYMLSAIPHQGGEGSRTINWNGTDPLPVSSYLPRIDAQIKMSEFLAGGKENLFYRSAEMLMAHGNLNVNCDDKNVWKAFLFSLRGKNHANLSSGTAPADTTAFSNSAITNNAPVTEIDNSEDEDAWNALRALSDDEVDALASQIVNNVRIYGPFLSVSDFVNRRLTKKAGMEKYSKKGMLQAAIDEASIGNGNNSVYINGNLQQAADRTGTKQPYSIEDLEPLRTNVGNKARNYDVSRLDTKAIEQDFTISKSVLQSTMLENRVAVKTAGLPGYLDQADLLTSLAPKITVRDDTFIIRAYGESRDARGKVKARAYCEATVQRIPDFVDESDSASEPVRTYDPVKEVWKLNSRTSESNADTGISKQNLKLGRQFKIVKFRWLSPSEI